MLPCVGPSSILSPLSRDKHHCPPRELAYSWISKAARKGLAAIEKLWALKSDKSGTISFRLSFPLLLLFGVVVCTLTCTNI
jgi:hypothetical protein